MCTLHDIYTIRPKRTTLHSGIYSNNHAQSAEGKSTNIIGWWNESPIERCLKYIQSWIIVFAPAKEKQKVAPTHFTTWHRLQSSIWYCRSLKWCLLSRRAYTQRRGQHEVHVCVCVYPEKYKCHILIFSTICTRLLFYTVCVTQSAIARKFGYM